MVKRFIGSGRDKEGGYLATHKQDFDAHVTAGDFRHGATDIDMEPAISAYAGIFEATTLQETLEKITNIIAAAGQGFLTIGDGYDTSEPPNFIVGSSPTPTLESAFNAAFSHPRMQQGGIILVKAGTYKLNNTVEVPNGITIMGEGRGTVIIGHMSFSTYPMFLIKTATEFLDVGNGTPSSIPVFNSASKTKIYNIVLGDNTDNYVKVGGVGVPTMTDTSMIAVESGANFYCEEVTFLGKLKSSAASPIPVTYGAIGTTTGSANPTVLSVSNCYIDGCGIGVEFLPSAPGDNNNLIIDKCRARLFGKTSTALENNCFVYFNTTNGIFSNNYIIFDTNAATSSPCFIKKVNISTNKIPKLNIIGNYGGKTNESQTIQLLVDSSANTDTEYSLLGNTIGNRPQNEWCITVGGGTNSTAVGDINGVNALNFVLQYMQDLHATVLIHAGNYNVTLSDIPASSGYSKLKLLGIKKGNYYPTIKLNLDALCSVISDYSILTLKIASEIKSIHFQSSNTLNYNSISLCYGQSPNSANGCLKAEDCLFTDVLLFCPEFDNASPTDPATGNTVSPTIIIKDCQFLQTSTFLVDYISLILPQYRLVAVDNCIFRGGGYALAIGSEFNSSYFDNDSQVILNNCIMDITGDEIGSNSIIYGVAGFNNYISISGTKINLEINNCKVTANNTLDSASTTIDNTFLSLGLFKNFIYIKCNSLTINNCIFNGPNQKWTDPIPSIEYAVTCLRINSPSISIDKCKFAGGALPLQISTDYNSFTNRKLGINYNITNSNFRGDIDGKSFCLLSIDNEEYPGTLSEIKPIIAIDNCQFNNCNSSSSLSSYFIYKPYTAAISPADPTLYFMGCVMISAANCGVYVSNSVINARLLKGSLSNQYAGLYIDNFIKPSSVLGSIPSDISISNNKIYLENPSFADYGLDTATTSHFAFSCYCKGSSININNNTITMNNYGIINLTPTCNYAGHLYLITSETGPSTKLAASIVSNNIFDKLNYITYTPGSRSTLKKASIKIDYVNAPTGRGLIVDNIFTSPYLDENLTPDLETTDNTNLIEISTYLKDWIAERNKNQTATATIGPELGTHTSGTGVSGITGNRIDYIIKNTTVSSLPTEVLNVDVYTSIYVISSDPYNGLKNLRVQYIGGSTAGSSYKHHTWRIPLSEVVPKNVKIIKSTITTSASGTYPTGAGEVCGTIFSIFDNDSNNSAPSINWTTSPLLPQARTLSLAGSYINDSSNPVLSIVSSFNMATGSFIIIITPISVTYRW